MSASGQIWDTCLTDHLADSNLSLFTFYQRGSIASYASADILLLSGELLAERCRTDDLLPSIPISCLPPCRMDPKVRGWTSSSIVLSQVVRGRLQFVDGLRAAAMMRWWSSSGAEWARCPKNLRQRYFTLSETGKHPVIVRTVSLVVCLVYGIRKIFRRHQVSKASTRFSSVNNGPCLTSMEQDWENVGPVELHLRIRTYMRPPDILLECWYC